LSPATQRPLEDESIEEQTVMLVALLGRRGAYASEIAIDQRVGRKEPRRITEPPRRRMK
jgi:hypothetical protein